MSKLSLTETALVEIEKLKTEQQRFRSETQDRDPLLDDHRMNTVIARFVLQTTPVVVADLDNHAIQFATPAIESLFGYLEGELQGKDMNLLLPARLRGKHTEHLRAYANNPTPRQMGESHMELVAIKRDGTEFNVEISLRPFVLEHRVLVAATILPRR